jgi:6-phosphofructo-2-kinase/fructose-2,6-biphosphatase 2
MSVPNSVPRTDKEYSKKISTARRNAVAVPHVICMVGLPARGKTYISRKLCRYLNWIGINARVFNVGEYRRQTSHKAFQSADFFRPDNPEAMALRMQYADDCMADTLRWLKADGDVAIFDATNTTRERRQMVHDKARSVSCMDLKSSYL